MARRSHGPAANAVKISRGPDPTPLHFYSTNYSTHYGNRPATAERQEDAARTMGTGYSANFRPAIYYSSNVDLKDNPHMIKVLADNYTSLTAQHFRGFHREAIGQLPVCTSANTEEGVKKPERTAVVKPRPLTSDPRHMLSETKSTFTSKPFRIADLESSSHSLREETGFTHAQSTEPITFRPPQAFSNLLPLASWRPTGCSVMKRDFTKHSQTTGNEGIPVLAGRVDQSNGYVKGSKHNSSVQPRAKEMVGYTFSHQLPPPLLASASQRDPANFSTLTHPQPFSSYTHQILEEGRRERRERRGREETGRKELTGYSENNHPVPQARDRDSRRFSSHYTSHFPGPPLHLTAGGVLSTDPHRNGFSKGTQVHGFTESRVATGLHSMHPSQARLVMERDPCYEDHTHYNKQRTTKKDS
jgi:protein phosphatase 1 regulatory subunit 32